MFFVGLYCQIIIISYLKKKLRAGQVYFHNAHFLHLPFYILSNPLDLFQLDWRERGIKNPKKAFEFLENYQWSALPDLIGKENFPEVINKNLFYELFNTNEKQFKKDFIEWFKDYDGEFNFNGLE
ncbi:MAG: hypothetical protein UV22_C0015G0002 [Parcubacteria group bacterium GW2011_GWA2_42_35]|nr:MAG: hypothetical protein UV22_C0015G0002 [Parcubacteria group bacterium GW2011_GWA2_42_35]